MKTQPWPKKLYLSSARAVALALFQLRLVKENFGVPSVRRHLECSKIFKHVDSIPENMAVTFADSNSKNRFPYYAQIDPGFVIIDNKEIVDRLRHRRYILKEQERDFVENLGLTYTN